MQCHIECPKLLGKFSNIPGILQKPKYGRLTKDISFLGRNIISNVY